MTVTIVVLLELSAGDDGLPLDGSETPISRSISPLFLCCPPHCTDCTGREFSFGRGDVANSYTGEEASDDDVYRDRLGELLSGDEAHRETYDVETPDEIDPLAYGEYGDAENCG